MLFCFFFSEFLKFSIFSQNNDITQTQSCKFHFLRGKRHRFDQKIAEFNPLKFASLIISKKRTKPQHPPLIMGNTTISEVTQHKHLGLVFSNDRDMDKPYCWDSESMEASWLFKTEQIYLGQILTGTNVYIICPSSFRIC